MVGIRTIIGKKMRDTPYKNFNIYKLNKYSNFQPLWANDNLKKGNRYKK